MPEKIDSLIVSKGTAITLLSNFNTVVGILKDLGPVHGFICLERYYFIFYLYKCIHESVMKNIFSRKKGRFCLSCLQSPLITSMYKPTRI